MRICLCLLYVFLCDTNLRRPPRGNRRGCSVHIQTTHIRLHRECIQTHTHARSSCTRQHRATTCRILRITHTHRHDHIRGIYVYNMVCQVCVTRASLVGACVCAQRVNTKHVALCLCADVCVHYLGCVCTVQVRLAKTRLKHGRSMAAGFFEDVVGKHGCAGV